MQLEPNPCFNVLVLTLIISVCYTNAELRLPDSGVRRDPIVILAGLLKIIDASFHPMHFLWFHDICLSSKSEARAIEFLKVETSRRDEDLRICCLCGSRCYKILVF